MDRIPVTKTIMPIYKDYIEEIKDLWDSHHLTNMGMKHEKLSFLLKEFLDTRYISLFTNGHLALETVLSAFELSGEVITTPYTFASTTHAIVRNGLVPVFCDIDPDTYTMDVSKIEELITDKTSAIVPVHVYGTVCDVEGIQEIADKYNLKVIYDAAHAFGVKVNGKGIGSFGNASMFSFHATKVFHTIEGGCVTFNDFSLFDKLSNLKNFGITGPDSVESVGGNAKMNEFQAAMGIVNFPHIDESLSTRKELALRYNDRLKSVKGVKVLSSQQNTCSNYAYYPVVFEGDKWNRDWVADKLAQNNVFARKYFYPLVSDFDCYREHYDSSKTPVARDIASKVLTLPLYVDMTTEEVDYICHLITEMSPYNKEHTLQTAVVDMYIDNVERRKSL